MLCQLPCFYTSLKQSSADLLLIFFFISLRWLMVPYRDNGHLTRQQIRFNEALSSQRQVIQCAIGLLIGRWRKLQYLNLLSVKHMTIFIMAACVTIFVSMMILMRRTFFAMMMTMMTVMLITP